MDPRSDMPLLPTLRHDPEADQALRGSLRVLRDRVDDAGLKARIDLVLTGRASLRDLARSEEFSVFITPYADEGQRIWEGLPADERKGLLRPGQPSTPS